MENTTLDPSQDVEAQKGSLDLLEEQYGELEKKFDEAEGIVRAAYDDCDPDTQARIDALSEALAENDDTEITPISRSIKDQVNELGVSKNLIEALVETERLDALLNDAEAELEKHAPEKAKLVRQKAGEIEEAIDYDKVVAALDNNYDSGPLFTAGFVISSGILIATDKGLSYEELIHISESLDKITDTFGSEYMKDEDSVAAEQDPISAEEFREFLDDTLEQNSSGIIALQQFRRGFRTAMHLTEKIKYLSGRASEFSPDANNITYRDLYSQRNLADNEQIQGALRRSVIDKIEAAQPHAVPVPRETPAYKEFVARAIEIDPRGAIDNINVEGDFDKLPFKYSLTQLRLFIDETIPPIAIAPVKNLEIRPIAKDETISDAALGFRQRSPWQDGDLIVFSDEELETEFNRLREAYDTNDLPDEAIESAIQGLFENTVVHEFAHTLHDELPATALKDWSEAIKDEDVFVSKYVEKEFKTSTHNKYKEDFAESAALFINDPGTLLDKAPARFKAMEAIYREFMPTYDTTLIQALLAK